MRLPSILHKLSIFLSLTSALQDFYSWGHERIQLEDVSIHFRYSAGGKPPLLLVHGSPEHSRTWIHMGPILAEKYTVIAPDNRGQGDSSLSASDTYTAPAAGADLRAILDFLNIKKTYVLAHDKGVGLAASLAFEHPELIERIILAEYPLPGFGYPTMTYSPSVYRDWQLAFFAVPDVAQYFIQGREKEMLAWYFFHGSYSGDDVISNDLLETYTRALAKPGFLRAMFQYFAAAFSDADYFTSKIKETGKLQMPLLVMGGEASFSPEDVQRGAFVNVSANFETSVVPKAGHWIPDENPNWAAQRAMQFFAAGNGSVPSIDLAWLDNTITMFGNFGSGILTPGTNGTGGE